MADRPRVAVVVPWRPGCPHREAAWQWVQAKYASEHPGWQVIEGTSPDGPWCKALAIQNALSRTDADTIVTADADCWVDNLTEAVAALDIHPFVVPHRFVHRLDLPATAALIAGQPLTPSYDQRPYIGRTCGGILALRRELWDRVPMDPRFCGWGHEDDSWANALATLVGGTFRLRADLWHLWHPPQDRPRREFGSRESQELGERYIRARRNPPAMQILVDEARSLLEEA